MSLEKSYFKMILDNLSDKHYENKAGIMYVSEVADKRLYISNVDAKNVDRESAFVRQNACDFCSAVYAARAEICRGHKGELAEFYAQCAEYYKAEETQSARIEDLYKMHKKLVDVEQKMSTNKILTEETEMTL